MRLGLDLVVDARLRERHAGAWEGRTRAEIDAGWPGFLESGRRPDGYEADASVLDRVLDALAAIATGHDGRRARRHPRGSGPHGRAPPRR